MFKFSGFGFELSPEFGVRVGRIALPVYAVSETRLVGYANPWIGSLTARVGLTSSKLSLAPLG